MNTDYVDPKTGLRYECSWSDGIQAWIHTLKPGQESLLKQVIEEQLATNFAERKQ